MVFDLIDWRGSRIMVDREISAQPQDEESRLYECNYRVRANEMDFRGRAHAVSILNYLQDIAGEHAIRLGFSVFDLQQRNLTWILHRSRTRIFRLPESGEVLKVSTWPSGQERIFALRDYEIRDQKDEILVCASSFWGMTNLKTMRPVRLEKNLSGYPSLDRRALDADLKPFPKLEKLDTETSFQVRLADLDINQHVNNSIYAGWAIESIPIEFNRQYSLAEIEIGFLSEAFYGDRVISRTQMLSDGDEPVFLHQLVNERNGKDLCNAKTTWRRG